MIQKYSWLCMMLAFFVLSGFSVIGQNMVDITVTSLFATNSDPKVVLRTKEILTQEIEKRSNIKLKEVKRIGTGSYIILALEKDISTLPARFKTQLPTISDLKPEGYHLQVIPHENSVLIIGKDARGLLYGAGAFLRKAEISAGKILIGENVTITTSPQYPVRGHQLGYRPKTNSYDAFTVAQFDQYIRELAIFGANSIEIMPPRTDDKPTSIHMKIPAIDMVKAQSRIAQSYGMDVWMWYPNLEKDYSDPDIIKKELTEREDVFKSVPKINQIFTPGGDPGDLHPEELFEWMEKVAKVLQKYHPEAKIWLSPQSFQPNKAWFDEFFIRVNQKPSWLGGLVFGPWVKMPMDQIKAALKVDLPIRNYPDISHLMASQYPISFWDPAWAKTLGREPIIPRPVDQKLFHNDLAEDCIGSITYSEGNNDDVNKFIWSDQDWNPKTDVRSTLLDYTRFFFGPALASQGVEAILALEENLKGPVLTHPNISHTLWAWQAMERSAEPILKGNFRFQMGLLRAYYDAYTQERLVYETYLEQQAIAELANKSISLAERLARGKTTLELAWTAPIREEWKRQCMDLADSLFKNIGSQLTIEKHGAMPGRGNFIDFIQYPLNDSPWLIREITRIEKMQDWAAGEKELHQLLHRTDPGPGGYYDHFGHESAWKRVNQILPWKEDPGSLRSPRTGYSFSVSGPEWTMDVPGVPVKVTTAPKEWSSQAEAIYDVPLQIAYQDLDPAFQYKIKIVYSGRFKSSIRLKTDDGHLIHDYLKMENQPVREFKLPYEATKDGRVSFNWDCLDEERGVQVSEIMIIRDGKAGK